MEFPLINRKSNTKCTSKVISGEQARVLKARMAWMADWTKVMARALKYAVDPLFFKKKRNCYPLGKGIIVPYLAVLSVVCKYKCPLQKQVGLFSESHPVGSILHMAFFVPSRKARKWFLVILTTGE